MRIFYLSEVLLPPVFGNDTGPFGITPGFVAIYITTGEVLLGFLVWFTIGAFMFWRGSDNGLAIIFSIVMVAASVFMSDYTMSLPEQKPAWSSLVIAMRAFTYGSFVILYYIFPDGRFSLRITRVLAVTWVAYTISWIFFPDLIPPSNHVITTPKEIYLGILLFFWLGTGAISPVYRYRSMKDPIQRQQIKWIVFGTSAAAVGVVATFSPPMFISALRMPGPTMVGYVMVAVTLIMICLALIPLTTAFSVLRYELWEVDLFINKALVYSILTAILTLLYFGSVVVLQYIVGRMSNQQGSPLVTVFSTLMIAALFSPLRRTIQYDIDRRFFQRRYDATRTLEAFNAKIRDSVDLENLSDALLSVVNETIQPEHMSLWLREEDSQGGK